MTPKRISIVLALAGLGLAAPLPAGATDRFEPLPAGGRGKPSDLLIRIIRFAGSTNGAITVDVKNPTGEPAEFSAQGLYFVPQGNPNEAPQRLGAVGPFQVRGADGTRRRQEAITIAPGATERLTLDVYCIDSHRASPSPATAFRVAKHRMPARLMRAIDMDAQRSAAELGGLAAPAAKPAIQSQVWKNRDANWLELDGEGKQEAAKHRR